MFNLRGSKLFHQRESDIYKQPYLCLKRGEKAGLCSSIISVTHKVTLVNKKCTFIECKLIAYFQIGPSQGILGPVHRICYGAPSKLFVEGEGGGGFIKRQLSLW